jgi:hypothetical protein
MIKFSFFHLGTRLWRALFFLLYNTLRKAAQKTDHGKRISGKTGLQ